MDKTPSNLISFAIGTEIDAINMYAYMIRNLPPEYEPKLQHIMDEEKEHALELIELLNGDFEE